MGRVKRIWYLSHMRAAKVQASLRIRAVSPEPPLLAHTSSESRRTVKIRHDGMLEDTNSPDAPQMLEGAFSMPIFGKNHQLLVVL